MTNIISLERDPLGSLHEINVFLNTNSRLLEKKKRALIQKSTLLFVIHKVGYREHTANRAEGKQDTHSGIPDT